MRCSHCRSEMHETETLVEGHSRQTWYECPLCNTHQTVIQPCADTFNRMGDTTRYYAGAAPADDRFYYRTRDA